MVKRFSFIKYVKRMVAVTYCSADSIQFFCECWVEKCTGLTEKEMHERGYITDDNWMTEVKE